MIVVITFFASLLAGLIGWWYYEYFKHSPFLSKYNGPRPIPIFGNIYRISSPKDVLPLLLEYTKKHGPVIKMWCGFRPRIIISDSKTTKLLLDSTEILNKSHDYKFFESWLGTGLLTSTGNTWRKQRKLLTPSFHFQFLEQYVSIFSSQSDVLIEKLSGVINTESVDIYPFITLCALDIVYESVMGIEIHAQREPTSDYIRYVKDVTRLPLLRMYSVFKSYNFFYQFTNDYKIEKIAVTALHEHTNYVIRCREKEFLSNGIRTPSNSDDNEGVKRRRAFLDLLLECRAEGADITYENIREQVDTFMFEGHDTVSSGLAFTLYSLAHNKEVQEKTIEEIRSVVKNVTTLTYQHLQDMKYLEMVIKESMRIFPPVPLIARELAKDTEFDGVIIPKGTNLTLFTYGLHRQEESFPDPEKFDPDRFLLENVAKRSPFSYVPFSAGVRNCIGQRFAMNIMKSVASKILINYELSPVQGFEPLIQTETILRSSNGIRLRLKNRKSDI